MPPETETQISQTDSQPTDAQPPAPAPHAAPDPAPVPAAEGTPPSSLVGSVEPGADAGGQEGQPPASVTLDDLTIPEGIQFEGEIADQFLTLINEPPESRAEFANALLDAHQQILQQTADTYASQWQATQEDWQNQVRQLPEIGGPNLDQSLGQIAQVLDRYGDQEVRDAFALTGAGNHPAMVRFLHAIAKDLNEAPPVAGQPAVGTPRDRASRMYPSAAQE